MSDIVIAAGHLGPPPWPTLDPFLFCVHHDDAYPAGNEKMGPVASLEGRRIGNDFAGKDGWRMYHGSVVPGFPRHPHRGFETLTLVRRGFIDHSDTLGATARFGQGDAQWMTAGKGIEHCEMFPLRERGADNPLELFQLWLNLPAADKMVDPYFTMMWSERIPRRTFTDRAGRTTEVVVVAGELFDAKGAPPPPDSWASKPQSALAVWTIKMAPGAEWTLPPAPTGVNRTLYVFRGSKAKVAGLDVDGRMVVQVRPEAPVALTAGSEGTEILMLQGRPIGEPVAQHGPFVMNTREEIMQAYDDYRRTRFGRWPWGADDPVHPREQGRFAIHADGRKETPTV